jgi:hypothetical protein
VLLHDTILSVYQLENEKGWAYWHIERMLESIDIVVTSEARTNQ